MQWHIQDFPEWSANPWGWAGVAIYNLPKNFRKLHENEEMLAHKWGASLELSPRSATAVHGMILLAVVIEAASWLPAGGATVCTYIGSFVVTAV